MVFRLIFAAAQKSEKFVRREGMVRWPAANVGSLRRNGLNRSRVALPEFDPSATSSANFVRGSLPRDGVKTPQISSVVKFIYRIALQGHACV